MKFTKRLLTIALSMGMVMPLCATAYADNSATESTATETITGLGATIKENADDGNLYDVTVTFSVANNSKQIALLLRGPNSDNVLDENDIVHINQFGKTDDDASFTNGTGICTFSVLKERVRTALKTSDEAAEVVMPSEGQPTNLTVFMSTDDATTKAAEAKVTYESSSATDPEISVKLDQSIITLTKDDTVTLKATVESSEATDKTVKWVSSVPTVATVDNGVVTAVSAGTAKITAFIDANDNEQLDADEPKAECTVTVTEATTPTYVLGDVNGDTKVDINDCDALFEHVMKRTIITDPTRLQASNVDGNDEVNINDCDAIFEFVIRKVPFNN